ncbi:AMP-binding protein [Actinomadura barringtoniae]|nr:AMP-binding protein [Actinomadura barringtoniae]
MLEGDRMFSDEAGQVTVSDATVTRTVIGAVRENAVRHGDRAAVRDARQELGFSRLAAVVPAAAAGLLRRGVRPGDVGAIHLEGACDFTLALHTVTAAGAVPVPLPPGGSASELARMMTDCGARFLLTGGETAAASLAATERSYVRQVFAFGEAPGATPFARLVSAGRSVSGEPAAEGEAGPLDAGIDPLGDLALRLCDPPEEFTHADRLADLYRLAGSVGMGESDVLVCGRRELPVATWVGLIDLCLTHGATFAATAGSGVGPLADAIERHEATIAVVTPAELRALTYDHDPVRKPGMRLLVTGTPDPEIVRACRERNGWTVSPLD